MNTKFLKAGIGLAVMALMISACGLIPAMGSGRLISQTRSVSGFTRVQISGGGDAEIIQDGTESVTVETDDNVMQYITSEVRGNTLYLGMEFNGLQTIIPTRLQFTVHVKNLNDIGTSGSWDVTSASIQTDNLGIDISGSGKVNIASLTASQVSTTVSGSGEVSLAGTASAQSITVSGSGKYFAGDLQTQDSQIRISGSGNATLWATQTLGVHVSGSGHVGYYGAPQVEFTQSGSGDIQSLGVK